MPTQFLKASFLAAGLAVAPVILTSLAATPVEAQAFSALRQAIAETSSGDERLAAFYRERGFEPVWTTTEAADRRSALIRALDHADAHGLPADRYDVDALRAAFREATNPYMRGQADVMASDMFLRYAQDVHAGFLDPSTIIPDIFQDQPHRDPYELMTAFLDSNPHEFMATLPPQTPSYARLMRMKLELEDLATRGGYGPTVQAGSLRPGDTGPAVIALRNRLMTMGYLGRSATADYDARLQAAVMEFQNAHGIVADGVAGTDTLNAINRSVEDHWNQIVLTMERQRWLNDGELHDRLIYVNLADFHTRVIDNGEVTFITRSVIGRRDAQTPEFSDSMEHMVINPSWWVPRSIARGYIPNIIAGGGIAGGGNHLQLMAGGRPVSRASVDWSTITPQNFPFDLRQPPGPRNALGSVKFMFPNRHAIYLHDSPDQHLMERHVRAYSAGCIRLDDPHDFAYHLLERQVDDPETYFQRILATRDETQVDLDVHLPVHLTYLTAWVESDGRMQTRPDIYGRNAQLSRAIRALGVVMPEVSS